MGFVIRFDPKCLNSLGAVKTRAVRSGNAKIVARERKTDKNAYCVLFLLVTRYSSSLWPKNSGNFFRTSVHSSEPFTKLITAPSISSTEARICFMLSRSLKVIVSSLRESKSTVIPKGVPSSSFREYRLPILADESSTVWEIPRLRSRAESFLTWEAKPGERERGTMRTFDGATRGGIEKT